MKILFSLISIVFLLGFAAGQDFNCNTDGGCQNGGTCQTDGKCNCIFRMIGTQCNEPNPGFIRTVSIGNGFLNCSRNPCFNGATCESPGTCMCDVGFTGRFCHLQEEEEVMTTLAPTTPELAFDCNVVEGGCLNGGRCQESGFCNCLFRMILDERRERCTQLNPSFVSNVRDENGFLNCARNPCFNGGTCEGGACRCTAGFGDTFCNLPIEEVTTPAPVPQPFNCFLQGCENGGECIAGTCFCPFRMGGQRCTEPNPFFVERAIIGPNDQLDCSLTPCFNLGNCFDGTCTCPPGFTGTFCHLRDPSVPTINCNSPFTPCFNEGECFAGTFCICEPPFGGTRCEIHFAFGFPPSFDPTNSCSITPCANEGLCIGDTFCACDPESPFGGPRCDTIDPAFIASVTAPNGQLFCAAEPCLNGECRVTAVTPFGFPTGQCFCEPGFIGVLCETSLFPPGFELK